MAKRIVTNTTPTTATANPATVPATTPSPASMANLVAWLASPANVPAGTRKAPPAAHTVAGMLLALLAGGPASLAYCATAVANAPSTGKAHNLAPLVQYMVTKWGYAFACQAGNLVLVARPANG